jgi:hypothetical protein
MSFNLWVTDSFFVFSDSNEINKPGARVTCTGRLGKIYLKSNLKMQLVKLRSAEATPCLL